MIRISSKNRDQIHRPLKTIYSSCNRINARYCGILTDLGLVSAGSDAQKATQVELMNVVVSNWISTDTHYAEEFRI